LTDDITKIPVAADAEVDDDEAEVAAMGTVSRALKPLLRAMRTRVIAWAAAKYGAAVLPSAGATLESAATKRGSATNAGTSSGGGRSKSGPRKKAGPISLDKTLNLHPKGIQSFEDFVAEKGPRNGPEQNVVAVYWLTRIAGVDPVGVDQVYTCYKDRGWRVPKDMRNHLQVTASVKAWIDTSSMESITVAINGENWVEHDLPAKPKTKA